MKTTIAIIASAWLLSAAPAVMAWPNIGAGAERERRIEREQDLYDEGGDAIDEHDWQRAARTFGRVADLKLSHADAALYWRAYALNKMGQRAEAAATLLALQKAYPKSKWVEDGKQLELEIRQSSGTAPTPIEKVDDENMDLKLMAINGLMHTDPERAIPILERLLTSNNPPKIKERAMFVLAQSNSPKAYEVLARMARSGNAEQQRVAIRYLGIAGGDRNRQLLADIYASGADVAIKKSVLKAFMLSGDKGRVLALAKTEPNPELRAEAVTQLGLMGGRNELSELYSSESNVDIRKKIIQAMFLGGSADKLGDIARNEPVFELKLAAIKNLGLMGGSRTGDILINIYRTDTRLEVRSAVVNAFFLQGNAKLLVDLARAEKDPALKRKIIERLSIMNSKEASEYLMEYLKD